MKEKIRALVKERNAVLLSHNYQPPEIQEMADLCGDSLELSIRAADTDAEVIVFCGVHFMAETASILSPDKIVLLPNADAGCPMADMITPVALRARRKDLPGIPVVTYVNSSAAVKALSTICCTSANAVAVVNSLDDAELLMTPDRNLARNTARHTDKKIHLWDGCCPIHDRLTVADVEAAKAAHPGAVFMAHPECRPEVVEMADAALSTSGMIRFAAESDATEFIVGTEVGLLYPLAQKNPGKIFYPASEGMVCPDMKKITPQDILDCLENMSGQVKVPEDIRIPALAAVTRMIELSR
ncbi:MAG: quinolinate synthase NadA [Desulfosarcina sp.]|nr:quinolinate synthase NadA [Desulfosarcina sp.]MBC2743897.1 quinolinate synthase NadA [Desulfosarcina sp.]MBC2766806.1 quinolinate synthase NadA [Desulfosarcina sp.]